MWACELQAKPLKGQFLNNHQFRESCNHQLLFKSIWKSHSKIFKLIIWPENLQGTLWLWVTILRHFTSQTHITLAAEVQTSSEQIVWLPSSSWLCHEKKWLHFFFKNVGIYFSLQWLNLGCDVKEKCGTKLWIKKIWLTLPNVTQAWFGLDEFSTLKGMSTQ